MRGIDFSSWQSVMVTLAGLALVTLIGVGVRLLMMMTLQQRRERVNRQINERLKTLIAAYKTLGGSFTGDLMVDPRHLRDLRISQELEESTSKNEPGTEGGGVLSERTRRIRDAVEAALSDILLLGTEEQVRLAEHVARDLVDGQPVHTHELVVSLRDFIRKALDLDPIPSDLQIPLQGPTRPAPGSSRGRDDRGGKGGNADTGKGGGGMAMGAGGMGIGIGMGAGALSGEDASTSDQTS